MTAEITFVTFIHCSSLQESWAESQNHDSWNNFRYIQNLSTFAFTPVAIVLIGDVSSSIGWKMECLVVILQLFLSKLTIFLQLCLRMLQEILIGTIHPFFACTRVSARVSAYKAFNRCLAFCNWNYISVIQVAIVVSEYPSPKVTLAVTKTARGFHSLAHLAHLK
jgi:hypothetical protein